MAGLLLVLVSTATAGDRSGLTNGQNVIAAERIRNAVRDHILRHAPWPEEQMRVKNIKFVQDTVLAPGQVALQVSPPDHTDWLGSIALTVHLMVDGKLAKRLIVPAEIEVWNNVVVTAKPLGKYQPIGDEDIRIERMNLARVPSNAIVRTDQALGRRTKRNLAANCILRKDQVELPPIVKRGEIVQVVAESDALKISVKGIAKENGAQGDLIKVVNVRSKKIIYAQVVDGQTVRVDF